MAVYYTALLVNVGCHADAHEQAKWFGDDIELKSGKYVHELGSVRRLLAIMRLVGGGNPPLHRFRVGLEFAFSGHRELDGMISQHATLARTLAGQLDLPGHGARGGRRGLRAVGRARLAGALKGDAIPVAARIAQLAEFMEVAHRVGGVGGATALRHHPAGPLAGPAAARPARRQLPVPALGIPAGRDDNRQLRRPRGDLPGRRRLLHDAGARPGGRGGHGVRPVQPERSASRGARGDAGQRTAGGTGRVARPGPGSRSGPCGSGPVACSPPGTWTMTPSSGAPCPPSTCRPWLPSRVPAFFRRRPPGADRRAPALRPGGRSVSPRRRGPAGRPAPRRLGRDQPIYRAVAPEHARPAVAAAGPADLGQCGPAPG